MLSRMEEEITLQGSVKQDDCYECTDCSKTFSYKKTLARHVRNKHTVVGKPCVCEYCNSRFNDKWAMSKHIQSTHMKKHHVLICPICHYKDSKVMIDIHFAKAHNIFLQEENHSFPTMEEFEKWKNAMEKATVARYVVNQKFKKKNGAERIIYNCHRSGFFKPRGKNKRRIKSQGTNKIMGFCPARLEFEAEDKGGIKVQFIKTHVGHENEVDKVFSQYEMRLLTKKPVNVETQTKKAENDIIRMDPNKIPVHLISNYCQIVETGNLTEVTEIKPIFVGEFSFNNNVVSIYRTTHQELRDEAGELLDDLSDSPIDERATLHSATLINVNSITTVDLDVLNNDKTDNCIAPQSELSENLQDLEMNEPDEPYTTSLDLNKLLTVRLTDEKVCDVPLDQFDEQLACVRFQPLEPDKSDASTTSVIISPDALQLTRDRQHLLDRFRHIIESVDSRDLMWEIKKVCEPAMDIMKNLVDNFQPLKNGK